MTKTPTPSNAPASGASSPATAASGTAAATSGAGVSADPEVGFPAEPRPPDIVYQLWFEQFKQINTLAVAATAGALILLQMGAVEFTTVSGVSVLAMAAAVVVAMNGQNALVEDAARGEAPGAAVRAARGIAGVLMAGGAGAFISYGYFG